MDKTQPKIRENWIDYARALAILFVIFGHLNRDLNVFFLLTSPIKIPLFFCVSGYLFKPNKYQSWKSFLSTQLKRVVFPYFLLSLMLQCATMLFSIRNGVSLDKVMLSITEVLSGEVLWFLPCLLFTEVYAYVLYKISGGGRFTVDIQFVYHRNSYPFTDPRGNASAMAY